MYAYLLSPSSPLFRELSSESRGDVNDPEAFYLSEGSYHANRNTLLTTESLILRSLSFTTHVALPHHLALTYLQTLDALPSNPTVDSKALAMRTLAHLNSALLSPQLLYLTHQPPSLAVAAIYLAAREVGVKLVSQEWWQVFDVDREELGFLVVGMKSMNGWTNEEASKGRDHICPLTVEDLDKQLERVQADSG